MSSGPEMSPAMRVHTRRALREIREFEQVADALGVDALVAWERVRALDLQLPHLSNTQLFLVALAEFAKWGSGPG